ncbi:MAG: GTPase HflX [Clostridia bacterium]|nr:GTPase HflX [Clostridia bacterium]
MSEIKGELAVLVSIADCGANMRECEISLDELERLLNTAGGECFCKVIQVKDSFDPRTCIGKGKVAEIKEICQNNEISLAVFDFELTPAQIRNLEEDLGGKVTVIDRSMLILDIFALHAVSGEGKLQVELAQLKYSAPRLVGHGTELSRQGGGIGSRGPGESKLETDRRHLREKVSALEARLRELEHNRGVMRAKRDRSGIPKIGIVGYTNAGKSTLLNKLTGAGVLSEDKLFATLDATTRKAELPNGEPVLYTDTVGFIRKLPHHLVRAFKSTLDEVVYSDILLIVSDINDPEAAEHIKVTEEVISELGASDKPRIYVFNKCDLFLEKETLPEKEDVVYISAKSGFGFEKLEGMIIAELSKLKKEYTLVIPYDMQGQLNSIYNNFSVSSVDYTDSGVLVKAVLDEKGRGLYARFIVDEV